MSKYVPAFLKNQQATAQENRFSALSEDAVTNTTVATGKPLVNTSLPAKEAPKLVPATLAALTGNGGAGTQGNYGGGGRSFSARFAEQARISENPDYKPPPKPINISSEEDFPTLGGGPKRVVPTTAIASTAPKPSTTTKLSTAPKPYVPLEPKTESGLHKPKFADLAKDWGEKHEEMELEKLQRQIMEQHLRREAEVRRSGIVRRRRQWGQEDEDDYYENDYDYDGEPKYGGDDELSDDSSEVPEGDGEDQFISSEDERDTGEHNAYLMSMGWKG